MAGNAVVSSEVPGLPSIDDIVAGIISNPKGAPSAADPEPVVEEAPEAPEEVAEVAPVDELEAAAEANEEAPVEEAPVEEPAPAPAKRTDPVAHKFAILSRRERELLQRQRELDAREAETQRKLQELQSQPAPSAKPKTALEALKQLGYSYQDLTLEVLGQKEETPADPMQQRLDELAERLKKVDELEAEQKRRWDALEKERTANIETQIRNSIVATAVGDEERYELLTTVGQEAFDLVYDVMQEYYQEKQALLTYEEACDIVEQYYEERAKALVSTRKLGSRAATPAAPSKPTVAPKPTVSSSKASGPKTLTQRHSTIASAEPDVNKMSRDEAIAFLSKKIPVLPD